MTQPGPVAILRRVMYKNTIRYVAAAAILALTLAPVVAAQESDRELREEIEQLKQGQKNINKQLEDIKKLLQARPAAPAAPAGPNVVDKIFDLGSNPVKGASTAKLTLVEFTDYQ